MLVKPKSTLLAVLAAMLLGVGHASAATIYDNFYSGTFADGTGTAAGPFSSSIRRPAFDGQAGALLVLDGGGGGMLRRFDANGAPDPFPALGTDSIAIPNLNAGSDIAVDESGLESQGNIYVVTTGGGSASEIYGFNEAGEPLSGFPLAGMFSVGGVAVGPDGGVWISAGEGFSEFDASGIRTGATVEPGGLAASGGRPCQFDIDSEGDFYFVNGNALCTSFGKVSKASPAGKFLYFVNTVNTNDVTVDRTDDSVYLTTPNPARVTHYTRFGHELGSFGAPDAGHSYQGLVTPSGAAVNPVTGDVWVTNLRNYSSTRRVEKFQRSAPITVPTVETNPASVIDTAGITLHGIVNGDGVDTTECHFEWGTTRQLGTTAPCLVNGVDTDVFAGDSGDNAVSYDLTGLVQGQSYYFRLSAQNANGRPYRGAILVGYPQAAPTAAGFVTNINTDSAQLSARVDPAGGETSFRFEWGTEPGVYDHVVSSPENLLASTTDPEAVGEQIEGLTPATTYHYRVTVENQAGTYVGEDEAFTTFESPQKVVDTCENALVRQQTGASLLRDCRAYELVSAADTGGYNVESDLVSGEEPLPGYPHARDRALYGVHDGGVPGPWNPTNRGVDPYLAIRGDDGWGTEYAGIPATLEGASGLYSSPLAEADPALGRLAFAGDGICAPCFADGSSNVPLRMPDGTLIKGMAGSLNPSADPAGTIVKRFSGDGSHFLFGSTAKFEEDANGDGTDATIYVRDLDNDVTDVVSKLPNGDTIQNGDGVAALDISSDGSRIVFGRLVSTDAKGNHYYDLYMYVGPNSPTIELTPGSTSGALYDGMTADGARVYFTTADALTTASDQDTDTSADIYRADVSGSGATLTRVSTGSGAGNTDSCDPPGTSANEHWNTVDGTADCSVAAIAGGGGVASGSGDIYFLSPEILDGGQPGAEPSYGAPNLYLARPGEVPRFVATLESKNDLDGVPLTRHTEGGSFGSFTNATGLALAPDGDVYVLDIGDEPWQIERYTAGGTLVSVNTSELDSGGSPDVPSQIAVDPTTGDLYVPRRSFNQVIRYSDAGTVLGSLSGFLSPSAVAVNPADHSVYLGSNYPQNPTVYVKTPTGGLISELTAGPYQRGIAVDSRGRVYVATTTRTDLFSSTGNLIRTVAIGPNYGVAVDPENDDVFVSQGSRVLHFTSTGEYAGPVDIGGVTTARSIAVGENHRLYLVEGGAGGRVRWFDAGRTSDLRTDNPVVVHAVDDPGTRHTEDFQVTPDGSFATLSSTLPLTEFENRRRSEIYRYDADTAAIDCASCSVATDAGPTTDTQLTHNGLNLADDGTVFFSSREPLVLGDSNSRLDVYEWKDGRVDLVTPGTSPNDSSLLTATADGVNVFFFTRDTLVREDLNRSAVKLYDARAGGGFPYIPPPVPCKASDECHGPSSPPPPALGIPTISGSGGNQAAPTKGRRCRRGKVRRKGRCVKSRKARRGKRRGHRRRTR